jgi:predicted acyltransferase
MIQPSFSFLVGVALPFSLARRVAEGQPQWHRTLHAFWRVLALILLGVFLRSIGRGQTYWTFEDTPTLGTMILGLLAGGVLRNGRTPRDKVRWLATVGIVGLGAGLLLGALSICPVVKRIWTPSWVLYSGGWCFLLLAGFYLIMDVWNRRSWALPLVVVGMNSMAAYLIAHLSVEFIAKALPRHLGQQFFTMLGRAYEPLLLGASVLLIEWLILWWMYRRKIFLRVWHVGPFVSPKDPAVPGRGRCRNVRSFSRRCHGKEWGTETSETRRCKSLEGLPSRPSPDRAR